VAATSAELNFPGATAVDTHGNVYVADTIDQEVRQITPDGTITRFAGTGTVCFTAGCGDNGSALTGQFDNPQTVAVDTAGDVYISDTNDQTVREVAPDGTITRVAGIHGEPCTTAPACGDGGPATSARLDQPEGVAVDAGGNLYIADASDNEVRMVAPDGTITRLAGTGRQCTSAPDCGDGLPATLATLNRPGGVAVDSGGDVFIADAGDNELRLVTADGKITRLAGTGRPCTSIGRCGDGGPAVNAQLNDPHGVAVNPATSLVYIADTGDNEVRSVGTVGGAIVAVAGNGTHCTTAPACGDNGPAASAQLNFPQGVTVDTNGNLDIADTQNNEIRQVAP
jgi:DNA-binding beta-propeller fold protein YncE